MEGESEMKPKISVIGNWKMHKGIEEATDFVKGFLDQYEPATNLEIGLAVPYTLIHSLASIKKNNAIQIGAQNMNDADKGAFTGEIAAKMLINVGAEFVLLGHSERRIIFGESDQFINSKVKRAVLDQIKAVICIGDTLEQYDKDLSFDTVTSQLKNCLVDIKPEDVRWLSIAYEPVWAIGTGQNATTDFISKMHKHIRKILSELYDESIAAEISLLYGGSVSMSNCLEIISDEQVDGLLIGGASLSLESFIQIVNDVKTNLKS